jgi:nitroreductase
MMEAQLHKTAAPGEPAPSVEEAILGRRSIRSYQTRPVAPELIERILHLASHAPSGSNFQPWRVHVLTGATLKRLGDALQAAYLAGEPGHQRDYKYYTDEPLEPYQSRRRACGWGLYGTLGIQRSEKERMKAQRATNYNFFGAPVGLVFSIDRRLQQGSYLDYGLFLQTVMLAARGVGLSTCPQASIGEYPNIVRRELGLSGDNIIVCGMALGYADTSAIVNTFSPARVPVEEFATYYD